MKIVLISLITLFIFPNGNRFMQIQKNLSYSIIVLDGKNYIESFMPIETELRKNKKETNNKYIDKLIFELGSIEITDIEVSRFFKYHNLLSNLTEKEAIKLLEDVLQEQINYLMQLKKESMLSYYDMSYLINLIMLKECSLYFKEFWFISRGLFFDKNIINGNFQRLVQEIVEKSNNYTYYNRVFLEKEHLEYLLNEVQQINSDDKDFYSEVISSSQQNLILIQHNDPH